MGVTEQTLLHSALVPLFVRFFLFLFCFFIFFNAQIGCTLCGFQEMVGLGAEMGVGEGRELGCIAIGVRGGGVRVCVCVCVCVCFSLSLWYTIALYPTPVS